MNRRDLLKMGAYSLVASQIPWPLKSSFASSAFASTAMSAGSAAPLLAFTGAFASSKWAGDNEDFPHEVLWNRDGFIAKHGGIPKPSLSCDLIIVGGGMAGLVAAHKAPQKNVIVLEQADRFGGNSKGETLKSASGTQSFSQGAAYICPPEEGGTTEQLLKELGLADKGRIEEGTPFFFENLLRSDLWNGEAKASALQDLQRVQARLREVSENEYPSIPLSEDAAERAATLELDKLTFEQWLKNEFGTLDPLVLEYFQIYCWSSFNASISELSAAQALNFVTAEVDGVLAFPGGNAAIANALYEAILKKRGPASLRANSFVVDIEVLSDRVLVCTFENGKLITLEAKNALFAAPKFFAKTVFKNLPAELAQSFATLNYRAYLVANVQLNTPLTAPAYDVFAMQGKLPSEPAAMRPSDRAFTDFVFADFAKASHESNPVLTVYRPLPYDGARQFLFNDTAFEKHRGIVEKGLAPVLEALGLSANAIAGIRMARWGHAVPVAAPGFLAQGHADRIENSAFGNRLQFIGQDAWANPAFETAVESAERALARIP